MPPEPPIWSTGCPGLVEAAPFPDLGILRDYEAFQCRCWDRP
jgi:hypothetical protein